MFFFKFFFLNKTKYYLNYIMYYSKHVDLFELCQEKIYPIMYVLQERGSSAQCLKT